MSAIRKLFPVAAAAALILGACATTSSDPHEGGLAGGIAGVRTGAYEERIRERERRLQRAQEIQAQLDAESRELEHVRLARMQDIDEARRQLDALEREMDGLEDQIVNHLIELGEGDLRVQRLQARLIALWDEVERHHLELDAIELQPGAQADRQRLEDQRHKLQSEFDQLFELSLELAR